MIHKKKLIEWRSEEIAKIILRQSSKRLTIETSPAPIFDLFVTVDNKPKYRFAVEVKTKRGFDDKLVPYLRKLTQYRNSGMINIPALIIKIDETQEDGEIDFLVVPSKDSKLLIRKNYSFKPVTSTNLDLFISKITKWWDDK